jgi:hypothetical protein
MEKPITYDDSPISNAAIDLMNLVKLLCDELEVAFIYALQKKEVLVKLLAIVPMIRKNLGIKLGPDMSLIVDLAPFAQERIFSSFFQKR